MAAALRRCADERFRSALVRVDPRPPLRAGRGDTRYHGRGMATMTRHTGLLDAPVLRDRDMDGDGTIDLATVDQRLYYLGDYQFNDNGTWTLVAPGAEGFSAQMTAAPVAAVAERYAYDAYGTMTVYDDGWVARPGGSAVDNSVTYAGYMLDGETGLYAVRNRYYHPTLGQWISRDPAGYVDGASLVGYCGGAPVGAVDPWGLDDICPLPKRSIDAGRKVLSTVAPDERIVTYIVGGRGAYDYGVTNWDKPGELALFEASASVQFGDRSYTAIYSVQFREKLFPSVEEGQTVWRPVGDPWINIVRWEADPEPRVVRQEFEAAEAQQEFDEARRAGVWALAAGVESGLSSIGELAADFIPGLNLVKGGYEAVTGNSFLKANESVSTTGRVLGGLVATAAAYKVVSCAAGVYRSMKAARGIREAELVAGEFMTAVGRSMSREQAVRAVRELRDISAGSRRAAKEIAEAASPIGRSIYHDPARLRSGKMAPGHYHPVGVDGDQMPVHVIHD
jgi:RHS repeat-associated protein